MKSVVYERLTDTEGRFIGFRCTVREYLAAGESEWSLKPLDFDEDKTVELSTSPMGIGRTRRARLRE